ncbi:MAG: hypothetical protein KY453_10165 [Gemmatimonadetes bacterium]|nr:hypothetical protein [Gemmatimonadota bacterium]
MVVSARTETALEAATARLADHLAAHPELELADVAATLQRGRRAFAYRRAVVARDTADAAAALRDPSRLRGGRTDGDGHGRPVVFLLPGGGAHAAGMGAGLYAAEPVYRAALERCCDLLVPLLGEDLRPLLLGEQPDPLERADRSLPAVFAAYNAGPHRVERWRRYPEYGDDELFTERIPYRETRNYVKILTRNRALYEGLYGEG